MELTYHIKAWTSFQRIQVSMSAIRKVLPCLSVEQKVC
jgi:hypothetical protein